MGQRSGLRPGVSVVSADGVELGRVARCGIDTFTVALGPSMKDEVAVRYEDVAAAGPGAVRITRLRDELVPPVPSGGPARAGEQHVASVRARPDVEKAHRDPGQDRPGAPPDAEPETSKPPDVTVSVETERVEVARRPAAPDETVEPSELVIPVRREQIDVQGAPRGAGETPAGDREAATRSDGREGAAREPRGAARGPKPGPNGRSGSGG